MATILFDLPERNYTNLDDIRCDNCPDWNGKSGDFQADCTNGQHFKATGKLKTNASTKCGMHPIFIEERKANA